jgi:hypothetical protein
MTVVIETGSTDQNNPLALYENVFESGTVTVSSEATDGDGLNAIEDSTFDYWTPSAVPANIAVDCGSAVECDCVGIASHTAGTAGTTVKVQSSDDGATWTTRLTFEPADNTTMMGIFPVVSARYWRVLQEDAIASLGVIKLGKSLVFPGGVLSGHIAINHSQRVDLLNNMSMKGQFLGNRIISLGAETEINFGLVETDFVDTDMADFEAHYNSGRTFFFASSLFAWPDDFGYCWRSDSELRPSYEEGGTLTNLNMGVSVFVEQ